LDDWWVTKEIREDTKKFLESNNNEYTAHQNLWDTAKAVLRVKFIDIVSTLKTKTKTKKTKDFTNKQPIGRLNF
jgi:hypothetical protein